MKWNEMKCIMIIVQVFILSILHWIFMRHALLLLFFMSTEWDCVYELRPPTRLCAHNLEYFLKCTAQLLFHLNLAFQSPNRTAVRDVLFQLIRCYPSHSL
jgi:hypothetical protein